MSEFYVGKKGHIVLDDAEFVILLFCEGKCELCKTIKRIDHPKMKMSSFAHPHDV